MGDRSTAEGAAGVGNQGEARSFDWPGFFRNRNVMVQAFLYALLFYKIGPSCHDTGFLLLWLLVLGPLCVLNLMLTHLLKELAAKRARRA